MLNIQKVHIMKNLLKITSKKSILTAVITSCLVSGVAMADDHCTDPVSDWQPKEKLREIMLKKGWSVKRIKVDDGCYEVKGRDRNGHRSEAKFSPTSLKLIEIEIKFDDSEDTSGYLDLGNMSMPNLSDDNANQESLSNKPKAIVD